MRKSNYDKTPYIPVTANSSDCSIGWDEIIQTLQDAVEQRSGAGITLSIECYQGVHYDDLRGQLYERLHFDHFIDTASLFKTSDEITALTQEFVTDDPVFGIMNNLGAEDFLDPDKLDSARRKCTESSDQVMVVFGHAASLVTPGDILVYADMARWEIQQRMRRQEINNLGLRNSEERVLLQYKRAYFIDWRVCDKLKRELFDRWDYVLDTNVRDEPKMVSGDLVRKGLREASQRPFRVVPFFDPGPWGGQWMKEVCDLDRDAVNYAWCFDCVPEENSLLLGFGDVRVELPSINVVFYRPEELLGQHIHEQFGAEFPIRFDFLDTMDGGNLSLQVHPLKSYIKEKFGMSYTQDESYYMLDAEAGAFVYLGLRDDVDPDRMIEELEIAQEGEQLFDAEKHVKKWPVKKHDHVLIPAGTVHCSGKNSMVLEISATPYIFTFKLWDWGRLGLDGRPRPIHINHGKHVIQWDRTASWTEGELINTIEEIAQGDGWREERTGLHELEFIETRRHWFTASVDHDTRGTVNVLNLIEGREAIVESPTGAFEPFIVHYAETFIIPAAVGAYTIRPYGESIGTECATIKAFVRPDYQ